MSRYFSRKKYAGMLRLFLWTVVVCAFVLLTAAAGPAPVYAQNGENTYAQNSDDGYAQDGEDTYAQNSDDGYAQNSDDGYAQNSDDGYAQDGDDADTEDCYELMILDDADLLTDAEEEQLFTAMNDLGYYGNVVFSSVTLEDGADYEAYAEETYYAYYGNEPGVLLQIDMGNRKITLSASTDMEDLIGSERESIVDNIYTYATDGDYLKCASEAYSEILSVLNDEEIAHTMKYIDNGILALILGLVINFAVVFCFARKKPKRGAILAGTVSAMTIAGTHIALGKLEKIYSPPVSSSDGGGFGGGGGGGGFSGGSSSHGF